MFFFFFLFILDWSNKKRERERKFSKQQPAHQMIDDTIENGKKLWMGNKWWQNTNRKHKNFYQKSAVYLIDLNQWIKFHSVFNFFFTDQVDLEPNRFFAPMYVSMCLCVCGRSCSRFIIIRSTFFLVFIWPKL